MQALKSLAHQEKGAAIESLPVKGLDSIG